MSSPSSAWRKLALSQPDRAQRHRELRPLPGGPHRAIDPPQDREHLCHRFTRRHTSGPPRHNIRTRTWVTARNHRRITAPHTRTFNHGAALVGREAVRRGRVIVGKYARSWRLFRTRRAHSFCAASRDCWRPLRRTRRERPRGGVVMADRVRTWRRPRSVNAGPIALRRPRSPRSGPGSLRRCRRSRCGGCGSPRAAPVPVAEPRGCRRRIRVGS